jgi:WD40 repeat protein
MCIKNVLNDTIISGDANGVIKLWKIETGELMRTIQAHNNEILKKNILLFAA